MNARRLMLPLGIALLLVAAIFAMAAIGGATATVDAAQNTPTPVGEEETPTPEEEEATATPEEDEEATATPEEDEDATATPEEGEEEIIQTPEPEEEVEVTETPEVEEVTPTATPRPRVATPTVAADDEVTGTLIVTDTTEVTAAVDAGTVITLTPTGEVNTERVITVVGEGRVDAAPDQAQVTVGVETLAESVQEALEENNARIEDIIDALLDEGVARQNIQTANFSIFTEAPPLGPEFEATTEEQAPTRFRVSQQLSVLITDLDNISDVLDAAIAAGANNVFGVNFSFADTDQLEDVARREALQDAFNTALTLADLSGVELVGVVSISEVIEAGPGPVFDRAVAAQEGGGGGPPIQPGQLTFTKQLQVTFSIQSPGAATGPTVE